MSRSLGILVATMVLATTVGCRTCNSDRYRLSSREQCSVPAARPAVAMAPRSLPIAQPTYAARPCDTCPGSNASPLPGYGSPTYPTVGGSSLPPGNGFAYPPNFNTLPPPGSSGDPNTPPALIPATPVPTTPSSMNGSSLPYPIPLYPQR